MKALITGINGFAGSFLAESLVGSNAVVAGTIQPGTTLENIATIKDTLSLFEVDLLDQEKLAIVFNSFSPDVIFHLAGASSVKESFDHPAKFLNVNVMGSLNLLENVKKYVPQATVLLVTSGAIYGESLSADNLVDEQSRVLPKSPYAVSKAAQDMLGRVYVQAANLKIVIARPFNHIGPRQSDDFFVSTVARQVAEIIKGKKSPELNLANIEVYRDFTDVRDMVAAYLLLSQKGRAGEAYNICSGKRYFLKDIVNMFIELSGKNIAIKLDPARLRKLDLVDMQIDNSKIIRATGWKPEVEIQQSLKDTLGYWLSKVA
ncbi:MAG: GDP-mannose 4,6-dehydratase [Candidatus Margulisbacteria bacterium]|nr:GDP-mannose 4,6-dehydratase [Candidatus Margulisiibacteriota bacterium]MBU1021097.1 GDP-mannose 4,6-dehydratase [Candidatus Margulisiibacteriota bacterium]MBU1728652.1 GDP-mannose 4,6-dehydratase [Candidatus Margulisiibacteriota bacterium]MBU1955103.1 GDP-mannose 4,6-dehydratase [Candidatus Margulisiibacteriota bacterium]